MPYTSHPSSCDMPAMPELTSWMLFNPPWSCSLIALAAGSRPMSCDPTRHNPNWPNWFTYLPHISLLKPQQNLSGLMPSELSWQGIMDVCCSACVLSVGYVPPRLPEIFGRAIHGETQCGSVHKWPPRALTIDTVAYTTDSLATHPTAMARSNKELPSIGLSFRSCGHGASTLVTGVKESLTKGKG